MSATSRPRPDAAHTRWLALLLLVAVVASSGAACPQVLRGYQVGMMPLPRVLPPQASLDQIIAAVHGRNVVLSSRTIDVHVTALRKKLADLAGCVETVRGVGYRFAESLVPAE